VDDHPDLESYVNELEAELDGEIVEIAAIDSDYNPNTDPDNSDIELDTSIDPIDDHEADTIRAGATREQTSADDDVNHASNDGDDESKSEDEDDDTRPLPKLRQNRIPSYGHLKGQDGDRTSSRAESIRHMSSCKASSSPNTILNKALRSLVTTGKQHFLLSYSSYTTDTS
jgi:hypothetical protein